MKQITLGSLFDGLGGWQIAAVRNGVKPIWSSEIEKFPLALTKARFPDTEQLGDVTKIDGTKIEAPDIVTAGSPCQNLSVAGNREGLAGGQSRLFRDSIRIIRQLRGATNGRKTRFFVWENVPGAFTSGSERGADFRAVLESLAETDIPMPKDGRWAEAGVVQCQKCEIAWRTLDAQYWLPQRRKRIFLVADFAESDRRAAKILFVSKSLSGNNQSQYQAKQGVAGTVKKSTGTASELMHGTSVVEAFQNTGHGYWNQSDIGATLRLPNGDHGNLVLQKGYDAYQHHNWREAESFGPLTTAGSGVRGDTPLVTEKKRDVITYDVKKTVRVRKHKVDADAIKTLLKESLAKSGLSRKEIAEKLGVPQTKVDHYFRQDGFFSIPDSEVWFPLKELLGITTDEFDAQVTEFVEKECNFDSKNRIYDANGVSPTITSVDADKTILQPITLYDIKNRSLGAAECKGTSPTLTAFMGTGGNNVPILTEVVSDKENSPTIVFEPGVATRDGGHIYTDDKAPTLRANPGDNAPTIVYPLEGNGTRESHRGPGYSESDKMFTLNTAERHAVAYCIQGNMVDRETKQWGSGVYTDISCTLTATDRHAVCPPQSVSAGFVRGQSGNTRGIGYKDEQSPTVIADDVPLVMSATGEQKEEKQDAHLIDGDSRKSISFDVLNSACADERVHTLTSSLSKHAPIVMSDVPKSVTCNADQKVLVPYQKNVGALCECDYKGAGSQYVGQDKLIIVGESVGRIGSIVTEEKAVNEDGKGHVWESNKVASLTTMGGKPGQGYPCVRQGTEKACDIRNSKESDINGALQSRASNNLQSNNVVRQQYAVRRLTPLECERLQGLPDNWTLIDDKTCSDSARYRAVGNGMAQPCADVVIKRIVEEMESD